MRFRGLNRAGRGFFLPSDEKNLQMPEPAVILLGLKYEMIEDLMQGMLERICPEDVDEAGKRENYRRF